jgi:hypothetical protein
MSPCNRRSKVGPGGGGGGVGAPLVRPHQGWPRSPPPCSGGLLAGPGLLPWWCSAQFWRVGGFLLGSFALFCFTLSYVAPFDHIPMYFVNKSCKTLSLQYMRKYVNSKSICVESLFVSPILDINWRSDMVVKDRQQSRQSMSA